MNREEVIKKASSYIAHYSNPNIFTLWFFKDKNKHAWCSVFCDYIFKHDFKCDWFNDCKNFAYVPTVVAWAKKKGYWTTDYKKAKAGDLVVYNWHPKVKNNYSHVGIVKELKTNMISIEGNTTSSVGLSNSVAQKSRAKKYIAGIVRLPYKEQFNLTRILKKGCKGDDVLELQKELNKRGYKGKNKKKLAEDKIFGDNVAYAVGNFQKDNKLVDDKKVGKNTAHKLGWLYKGK